MMRLGLETLPICSKRGHLVVFKWAITNSRDFDIDEVARWARLYEQHHVLKWLQQHGGVFL